MTSILIYPFRYSGVGRVATAGDRGSGASPTLKGTSVIEKELDAGSGDGCYCNRRSFIEEESMRYHGRSRFAFRWFVAAGLLSASLAS